MNEEVDNLSTGFYGNNETISRLGAKQKAGRLPHGIIFSGPAGVGKRTCALRLAKTLNCSSTSFGPCDQCVSCGRISAGSHPDVFSLLIGEDAHQIKIDQVRSLLSTLHLSPLEGKAKVYIFDPAERMSPGAANALLKALEEPPVNTYFFLISENFQSLIPTVRSRCQVYHFSPLKREEIRSYGIEDELIVRWARGSIGRALSLDGQQLRELRDLLLNFLEDAVTAADTELATLLTNADVLSQSKEDYGERIGALTVILSDLILLQEGLSGRLVNFDIEPKLQQLLKHTPAERLIEIGEWLKFMELNAKYHLNKTLISEFLLLKLNERTSKILNKSVLT